MSGKTALILRERGLSNECVTFDVMEKMTTAMRKTSLIVIGCEVLDYIRTVIPSDRGVDVVCLWGSPIRRSIT